MLNKKMLGLLSVLIIMTLTAGTVFAEDNSTQILGNSSDTTDDAPTITVKSFTDLQREVDNAQENSVLIIDGYYISTDQDKNMTEGIYVDNKTITIEGKPNTVIDANNKSGAFIFAGNTKTVTLKNLIIKNGVGYEYGGAIYSESKIVLINCTFIDNIASVGNVNGTYRSVGGAIYNHNTVTATDCEFIGNGAISCGVLYYEDALTCTNCRFVNNFERLGVGLIYADLEFKCTLNNCRFENNSAVRALINVFYAKLTCNNITFVNNKNSAIMLDDVSGAVINNKKYSGDYVLSDSFAVKYYAKATTKAVSTTYNSGATLKITVTNTLTNKVIGGYSLKVKIYTGSSYKTYSVDTNSKGVATIKISTLSIASHKIEITSDTNFNELNIKKVSTTVKVAKAKTTVKAPKVTNKYKKSKYFSVTIKDKATKKIVKNLKIKVKVYTGKKYKTYTIKTNSKGVAKLNTKSLKVGSHKVVISSGNAKYTVSAKSTIKIKR